MNILRLRHGTHIAENQFDFMPKGSTIEANDLLITKIDEDIRGIKEIYILFLSLLKKCTILLREIL